MLRRTLWAFVPALTLAVVLAATAQAGKPVRVPYNALPPVTFPAGVACSFPLTIEALVNKQTQTTFSNGEMLQTGGFVVSVQNASNPDNSLTLNVPGAVRTTVVGSELHVTTHGPILFVFFPGDAGPGDVNTGRTYLIDGRAEFVVDPTTFAFVSFVYTGHATDICAALA